MNIKSFKKIRLYLLIVFGVGTHIIFAAQVPLVLQAKLTHLLNRLDASDKLTTQLAAESEDLISRLQQINANAEIQRIQKRLNQLSSVEITMPSSEEDIKSDAEETPLLEIVVEPVEEQKEHGIKKSLFSMPNIAQYLKLHGAAATQRIRNLTYPALGLFVNTATAILAFGPSLLLCEEEEWETLARTMSVGPSFAYMLYACSRIQADASFFKAIITGDLRTVKNMLETKLVNVKRFNYWLDPLQTPLMKAAEFGRVEIAKFLLEKGANIAAKDSQGRDVVYYTQPGITDSPDLSKRKLAVRGAILEHQLKKKKQMRLRGLYEPAEILAAEAIEALHTSMYGRAGIGQAQDISGIVRSYLTPTYVNMPRAGLTRASAEQKIEEEK